MANDTPRARTAGRSASSDGQAGVDEHCAERLDEFGAQPPGGRELADVGLDRLHCEHDELVPPYMRSPLSSRSRGRQLHKTLWSSG